MIIIPKIPRTYQNTYFVAFGRHEFGGYAPDSDAVVFRAESTLYRVFVNDRPCEVRACRTSRVPFNRPWPGKQRPQEQSEETAYVSFCADEAVTLRVRCEAAVEEATLRPLSRRVTVARDGEDFVFTLRTHGAYTLEIGDAHRVLHIFFDPIKAQSESDGATYYFGPGLHFPGTLHLRDHDRVYIDREAIVFGSLFAQGATDLHIFGGGVIDNSCEERITEHCYEPFNKGCVRFYDCKDITVEDVILTNSCTWALSMFECDDVVIDGVKIVGQWRYNADGVDIVNSRNVQLKNSFIRAFDDVISIKGIYAHPLPIEHISIEGCVLWCDWGHTCEIGVETSARAYRDITFCDCDVIRASGPALAVECGNDTDITDVVFENIRVEFQKDMLPEILQMSDGQVYDPTQRTVRPFLISVSNAQYALRTRCATGVARRSDERVGRIHGVAFRDIHVFADASVLPPEICVYSAEEARDITELEIDGLFFNGERCLDLAHFFEHYHLFDGFSMR